MASILCRSSSSFSSLNPFTSLEQIPSNSRVSTIRFIHHSSVLKLPFWSIIWICLCVGHVQSHLHVVLLETCVFVRVSTATRSLAKFRGKARLKNKIDSKSKATEVLTFNMNSSQKAKKPKEDSFVFLTSHYITSHSNNCVTLPHTTLYRTTSHHITSHHITSHHITSRHMILPCTSCQITVCFGMLSYSHPAPHIQPSGESICQNLHWIVQDKASSPPGKGNNFMANLAQ